MQHNIDAGRVDRACSALLREVNGLAYGEALLAVSQALGRLIVGVASTPIQMHEMVDVAHTHLITTVNAGASAKGFGNGH